jgi:hypothetical protein
MKLTIKLSLVLVACILINEIQAQNSVFLGPPVKSFTANTYENVAGKMKIADKYEAIYLQNGKILSKFSLKPDASSNLVVKQKTTYTYDSSGKKTTTKHTVLNDVIMLQEDYLYDFKGNIQKINRQIFDSTLNRLTHIDVSLKYSPQGDMLEEVQVGEDGKKIESKNWTYQNNAITFFVNEKYKNNKLLEKVITEYKYSRDGLLQKAISTNTLADKTILKDVQIFENNFITEWLKYRNGQLISRFAPNKHSNIKDKQPTEVERPNNLKDQLVSNSNEEWSTNIEYDEDGKQRKVEYISKNNTVLSVLKFSYDPEDRVIKIEKDVKEKSIKEDLTFSYDIYGNILSESLTQDGQLKTKREYQYEFYSN